MRTSTSSESVAFVDPGRQALAVDLAEKRLGRPLTRAERAIDIVAIDRDLAAAKARLATLIDARKRAAVRARLRGSSFRLDLTEEMVAVLRGLYAKGRAHANAELRRLGERGLDERRFASSAALDRAVRKLAVLLAALDAKVRGRTDEALDAAATADPGVVLDLSALARTAAVRAAVNMGGPLDAASQVVSAALDSGIGDVFSENAGLFAGFAYSAVLDAATCSVCEELDGSEYDSWEAIQEVLPDGGPNPDCDGDGRCRCRPVPIADELAA